MNTEQLKEMLISLNFSIAQQNLTDTGVSWYAYKRITKDVEECQCNDRKPSFVITPNSYDTGTKLFQSVEFSLTAESVQSVWIDFKVYGIKFEEVANKMSMCENMLIAAWNAANKESEQ